MSRQFPLLLVETLLVLVLIVLGWGLGNIRGFLVNPARSGLVLTIVIGSATLRWLRLELLPFRTGTRISASQTAGLIGLILSSALLVWFLPRADRLGVLTFRDREWTRILGLSLCCLGMAVRLAAMLDLGRQFSAYTTLQHDHQLIQSGIYHWCRHPLYLSLLLAAPGFALVFRSFLGWPILLFSATFVAIRIRAEERLLAQHFGEEFSIYQRRTRALLPGIL